MMPAALVLAIMILPTVAAISEDAFRRVPYKVKEAAYGMGTTRWEAIIKVMLPTASRGIFAALVLGFGRALGETMALAMLIGNSNQISLSLFAPANTLASLLAYSFPEAGRIEVQALMYAAIALLVITFVVNIIGLGIISRHAQGRSDERYRTDHDRRSGVHRPNLSALLEGRAAKRIPHRADLVRRVPRRRAAVLGHLHAVGEGRRAVRHRLRVFTELPPAGFEMGGGFGNAIVGTLVMVGIAALIGVPVGILAAVYLAGSTPTASWRRRRVFSPRC